MRDEVARRARAVAPVHAVALLGAVAVAATMSGEDHWRPLWLAVIAALTVMSDLTHVEVKTGRLRISGSFLGLVLGAVVLGAGPGALLGAITIGVGRLRSREAWHYFRNNLVTYVWFPLLSGLLFHAVTDAAHLTHHQPAFYVLVLGVFVVALLVNFVLIAGYQSILDGSSLLGQARQILIPIVVPELFSASLTLAAVYLATELGLVGLVLFAFVVILFQYLVRELLVSQRRGEELRVMATTDDLTRLPNRKSFDERLTAEIQARPSGDESLAVILLDLDRFKEINDTLGHKYGDELLEHVGPRLAAHIGPAGVVARLGGDEFAVLRAIGGRDEIELLAAELIACVHEPTTVEGITLEVGSSLGIARYPEDGTDSQTLLRRADIALNAAKQHGDSYRFYDASHDHHSTQQLSLLGGFREALSTGQVVVHYQPIVDLHRTRVSGAEALVRWEHPTLGLLPPGRFLSTVEQTALIGPLTRSVLDQAIRQCAQWRRDGLELTVCVNLSVRNLMDAGLPAEVARLLERYHVPAGSLQLEITESMIMSDPVRALATVDELRRLGVRLAVDDFGTGHSSLANLKRLPVDELKIDRSFVTPMLSEPDDLIIVRSTIRLGHDLGLAIIAEGVEDAETLVRLRELGCDHVQGYHLSRPMPAEAFTLWASAYGRSAGGGEPPIWSSRSTMSPA